MRPAPLLLLPLFLLLALTVPGPLRAPASAQDASSDRSIVDELSVEESNERAAELMASIREDAEAKDRYLDQLQQASAEDSLVLSQQISTRRIRALQNFHRLTDLLLQLENSEPQPELRSSVESLFALITPLLHPIIDRLRGEIDALRAQRMETPVEQRLALEDRIARLTQRLDRGYLLWSTHLEKLEALGQDPSALQDEYVGSLLDRADELSGRLDLAVARVDEYNALLKQSPKDADLTLLLAASRKSLDTNTSSLTGILTLMEAQDLPTDVYRTQIVSATMDLSSGLLDSKVTVSLFQRWLSSLRNWLVDRGPQLLVKLFLFLLILVLFRLLARLTRRLVARGLKRSRAHLSQLLTRMVIDTAGNLMMLLGIMVALSQLGISLGPLMAGLGVAGFILGFALQDSLSNFAAGMMILIYRPYDVGDLVDISGVFGKVDKMSLVSTTILTLDHQTLVVPNSKIWGDVIKNVTAQNIRRVDMTFGISYSDDIPKAEGVFEEILRSHPRVLDDPAPMVRLHNLGDSSVDFVVRPWVKTSDYWDVYWDVTRSVKLGLDEAGISIPFPQRDVHIYEEVLAERTSTANAGGPQDRTPQSSHTSHDSPSDDDSAS